MRLARVERAEQFLMDIGFGQVRVRSHGDLARIELCSADIPKAVEQREKIHAALKEFGFAIVREIDENGADRIGIDRYLEGAFYR